MVERTSSAIAVAACFALGASIAQADILWGVNGHPLTAYPGVPISQQLDLVVELKLKSYRVDVTHLTDLDRLGEIIAAAKARELSVLPILIPPVDLKTDSTDVLYAKARAFAEAAVSRFKADVPVWEIGNELENFAIIQPCEMRDDGTQYPCEWGPAGGVGKLDYVGARAGKVVAVLRGLSDGVHATDPKARRALGSAGWGHTGIFDRLRDAGVEWDVSVWHMYGGDSEWAFKLLAAFGKPIWVTEFNHPFGSNKDGEEQQAQGLEQIMVTLRKLAPRYGIEAAFIYELLDETYWAPSFEASMGLVQLRQNANKTWILADRKIGFQAVRRTISLGDN